MSNKIVLLSDSLKQIEGKHKAKDLFYSDYFKKTYEYATLLNTKYIYIITSKYGIIPHDKVIDSYSKEISFEKKSVFNNLSIITDLIMKTNLIEDEFILLTKDRHVKLLTPWLSNYNCPFLGLKRKRKLEIIRNYIFQERMKQIRIKNYRKPLEIIKV